MLLNKTDKITEGIKIYHTHTFICIYKDAFAHKEYSPCWPNTSD